MQELSKGLILFSALLSPLAMADWQLNVDLQFSAPVGEQTSQSSIHLSPGEEAIFLESSSSELPLRGSAELLDVNAETVTVAFTVEQLADNGDWVTFAKPIVSTGIDTPAEIAIADDDNQQTLNLAISVSSH
ncbi:hypothetical protein [Thaumasiovibrio subtropicus]|uniref:hypothetical protein n=1 Tax=Thaumasiovibrio subtropicus TaxID=1891207 RepID=UPI000B350BC9|nr:hypothetical protein [Thaumasiovibrio subtropicus]